MFISIMWIRILKLMRRFYPEYEAKSHLSRITRMVGLSMQAFVKEGDEKISRARS